MGGVPVEENFPPVNDIRIHGVRVPCELACGLCVSFSIYYSTLRKSGGDSPKIAMLKLAGKQRATVSFLCAHTGCERQYRTVGAALKHMVQYKAHGRCHKRNKQHKESAIATENDPYSDCVGCEQVYEYNVWRVDSPSKSTRDDITCGHVGCNYYSISKRRTNRVQAVRRHEASFPIHRTHFIACGNKCALCKKMIKKKGWLSQYTEYETNQHTDTIRARLQTKEVGNRIWTHAKANTNTRTDVNNEEYRYLKCFPAFAQKRWHTHTRTYHKRSSASAKKKACLPGTVEVHTHIRKEQTEEEMCRTRDDANKKRDTGRADTIPRAVAPITPYTPSIYIIQRRDRTTVHKYFTNVQILNRERQKRGREDQKLIRMEAEMLSAM